MIGNSDPDFSELVIDKEDSEKYRLMPFRSPAGADLFDYAEKIINGSVDITKEGILFQMLNHIKTSEGQPVMSDLEFKNFFCLLVAAGNDTTRYSIAMAVYQLSQNKKLFDYLKSSENYSRAADEFIRVASPTMYFRRTATCDFELHEKRIREGDKVVLWFVSGNYDKTVFNNPFDVEIDRYPNPHLSFGKGGVHFCLGTWLARMELKIILEELCKNIKSLKKLSEPTWTRSNFICGVKSLDVEIQK
ncbi:MAG: cytochrome P450 [Paracoccaceae bacterium]